MSPGAAGLAASGLRARVQVFPLIDSSPVFGSTFDGRSLDKSVRRTATRGLPSEPFMGRTTAHGGAIVVAISALLGSSSALAAEAGLDFNRDVRPILSDRCFSCHGPDAEDRQAGLRLDLRDAAIAELDSGTTAVVPGDPVKSEIIARITSTDPDVVMPPPRVNKPITPQEAEILRRWITQGAEYRGHWAFERVERP